MVRRAFTLLELLVVLVVLALLAGMLLPDFGSELRRRSLMESAERLRALIVMTHAQAMQDGRAYRIQQPGTPDPDDPHREEEIDVPIETVQPEITRQADPLGNPDAYEGFDAFWNRQKVFQDGTRCVAVIPGKPGFDITANSPIAGPQPTQGGLAPFVPLTLYADGTCDWVTFVLTDLPFDVELASEHAARILNVVVDGRTGQTWIQRALRAEEVEMMAEHGASPILHVDFTVGDMLTEDNILQIHQRTQGVTGGRTGRQY